MSETNPMASILDHYRHPVGRKSLTRATHSFTESNPVCGDTVTFDLCVEGERIIDIGFGGKACALTTASASMLCEQLTGKDLGDLEQIEANKWLGGLQMPMGPGREGCILLPLHVLRIAAGLPSDLMDDIRAAGARLQKGAP